MPDELAELARLRSTLVDLRRLIADPATPSGARRRATLALGDCALRICDAAMAALRARQGHAEMVP